MANLFMNFTKKVFDKEVELPHLIFVLVMVLGVFLSFIIVNKSFESSSREVKSLFSSKDSTINKYISNNTSDLVQVSKLKEQFELTEKIKKSYLLMADKYNSFDFTFSVLFTVFSIISALLAFLVFKQGWDNVENFYLKTSFLIFFFSSSLFGILPKVFNNKENSKKNFEKYNFYNALQMDIYNILQDNHDFIKNKNTDTLGYFISKINTNIRDNQELFFDTDIEKVPKDLNATIPGQ